jgi:hypothetical protein
VRAYAAALDRAASVDEVLAALPAHACRIVGAYACLVFLRGGGSGALRARPDARLRSRAEPLRMEPLRRRRQVRGGDAARDPRFARLAPLFEEEGAVSLACAPLPGIGSLVLVERRHGRIFDAEDWSLLSLVSTMARSALERVRVAGTVEALRGVDPETGLVGRDRLRAVLLHAWERVRQGYPLSIVVVAPGPAHRSPEADPGPAWRLSTTASTLREVLPPEGVALRYGAAELLLVLPGTTAAGAAAVVARLRERLGSRVALRCGIAGTGGGATAVDDLLQGAETAAAAASPGLAP